MSLISDYRPISLDPRLPKVSFGDQIHNSVTDWDTFTRIYKGFAADTSYILAPDEVTVFSEQINEVLRWEPNCAEGIMSFKDIGKGATTYEIYKDNDVLPPRRTTDFEGGNSVLTSIQKEEINLTGYDYDYHLTMPQLDIYTNVQRKIKFAETFEQRNYKSLVRSLAQYRQWTLFRGSDIPNMVDIGIKGLVNWAGITDPGAVGTADSLVNIGDVRNAAITMAGSLIKNKFKPPFDLHMTPLVFNQALKNRNATTGVSDMKQIMEHGLELDTGRIFKSIVLNPFLIDSETETVNTGAMLCVKAGDNNFQGVESYKMGFFPTPPISLGVNGKILWMGGVAVRRPEAIVYADALTTN